MATINLETTVADLRSRITTILQAADTDTAGQTLTAQVAHWSQILALEPDFSGDTTSPSISITVSEAEEDTQAVENEPGLARITTRFVLRIAVQVAHNSALTVEQNWLAAKNEAWRLKELCWIALMNNRGLVPAGNTHRPVNAVHSEGVRYADFLPVVAGDAVYYSLEYTFSVFHAQRAFRSV